MKTNKRMNKKWYSAGIRFECQGSGKCCLSRGEYGYVYLTLEDRKQMAGHLRLSTREFTRDYCEKSDGYFRLKHSPDEIACRFLSGKQCSIYEARPMQCRTWPFWPEVMSPKAWAKEVSSDCPGVGKGKLYSAEEIDAIVEMQQRSERKL